MKNFISSRSLEDWFLYGIIGIMIIGGLLFVVGYMLSFNVDSLLSLITGEDKTSISRMLKSESYPNDLFTLMTYLISNEAGSTAYNMCVTAMTGVALLFFIVSIIIVVMVWGTIVDIILPKIKSKKTNKN